MARALNDYLEELTETGGEVSPAGPEQPRSQLNLFPVGNLCPVCGHDTMVYTEGCQRCYACGHSEC